MIESLTPQSYPENQKELFEKLSRLSEVERELKFKIIAGKLKVSKTSFKNDFNLANSKKRESVNIDELLEKCEEGCKVYTAQNYYDGILSYGAVVNGNKLVIESNGNVIQSTKEVNMKFTRSKLTKEAIKRFRNGEDVNGKKLHDRLFRLFSDHIIFHDGRIPKLLATWVMGTYMFKAFLYYGYLLFISPVKRCAKSLAEDLLSHVCHNATNRSVNPSEASVFRQVDGDDITLIIDEVESLSSKEKDKKSEMFSLLNSGFQKDSTVTRIESRGKEFFPVSFNAYSPKVLAGIKGVSDTLEDRSFKIPMIRKAPGEKVKRFNLRQQDSELQQIRDDCYIFGLKHGPDVIELYDSQTGEFPGMEGLDNRLKDILKPLLAIASVIDTLSGDTTLPTVKSLIDLSKDLGKGRKAAEDLNSAIPVAVSAMKTLLNGEEEKFVSVEELFEKFGTEDDLGFIHSKRGMAFFLSKIRIDRASEWKEGKTVRGYVLSQKHLDNLGVRYA